MGAGDIAFVAALRRTDHLFGQFEIKSDINRPLVDIARHDERWPR